VNRRAEYYAIRRLNPYQGVLQVVDLGGVRMYSSDGRRWQVRRVEVPAGVRPAAEIPGAEARAALERRPPVPYPLGDRLELWLLDRRDDRPLALLASRRWRWETGVPDAAAWRPFAAGGARFVSEGYARRTGLRRGHAERLARLVEYAARPHPRAQWFERRADGSGVGLHGLRVGPGLEGRLLPAAAFPELLVREDWPDEAERALVADFHAWHAAHLLAHDTLRPATRARLERAAAARPVALLEAWPAIPTVLDRERLRVALVQGRLMRAAR